MWIILAVLCVCLLAGSALAVSVAPNAAAGVAAVWTVSSGDGSPGPMPIILCTDGQAYDLADGGNSNSYWRPVSLTLPVPVSDVADWTPLAIKTNNGDTYLLAQTPHGYGWKLIGQASRMT